MFRVCAPQALFAFNLQKTSLCSEDKSSCCTASSCLVNTHTLASWPAMTSLFFFLLNFSQKSYFTLNCDWRFLMRDGWTEVQDAFVFNLLTYFWPTTKCTAVLILTSFLFLSLKVILFMFNQFTFLVNVALPNECSVSLNLTNTREEDLHVWVSCYTRVHSFSLSKATIQYVIVVCTDKSRTTDVCRLTHKGFLKLAQIKFYFVFLNL